MARTPVSENEYLRQIKVNRADWEALEEVADAFMVSRTFAVNQAIAWMVREKKIPGFIEAPRRRHAEG